MFVALQIATGLAVLSEPFLPFTSAKLKSILNVTLSTSTALSTGSVEGLGWKDVSTKETLLRPAHKINKAELLFRKIEDEEIQAQLDKLAATKKSNASDGTKKENNKLMPQKDTITYDDFSKLDMRVGTILEAEKMPKTDKLMVMQVDTGLDTRTIVSGIAEHFTPEELIGRKVTVLINLAPRKLRGTESQGMILLAESADGKLIFVNPDEDGVGNGLPIS